jgi:F-type H+-transporting ATPase subunit epsilon
MAETFAVKLVTPTGIVFEGQAEMVTAVGPLGEFGVLPNHINFVSSLVPSLLEVRKSENEAERWVISGGLAEVKDGAMTILANDAETPSQIDLAAAQSEEQQADKQISTMSAYEPGYAEIDEMLQLARARIRAASSGSPAH